MGSKLQFGICVPACVNIIVVRHCQNRMIFDPIYCAMPLLVEFSVISVLVKRFGDECLAFYGLEAAYEQLSIHEVEGLQSEIHSNFEEADILRPARHFGGDYLVQPAEHPSSFPRFIETIDS